MKTLFDILCEEKRTQRERIEESKASKAERQKFTKEMRMCNFQTYNIRMDGIKTDLKCITQDPGIIVKYAKKALTKKAAMRWCLKCPIALVLIFMKL